ncbi:glycosyltransferase family 9 protein [Candidatus Latescibacterota bacterium]
MNNLLVRTGGLGDCALTLPVAASIKRRYPGAGLHVLGNETMLSVARLSGIFDGFHSVDAHGYSDIFSPSEPADFVRSFFMEFENVYFFTTADKDNIIRKITDAGAQSCYVLDPRKPDYHQKHIIQHLMTILGDSEPGHDINDGFKIIGTYDSDNRHHGIVIHPGSGSLMKNWPLKRYIRFAGEVDNHVTFILGPAEIERGMYCAISPDRYTVISPETLNDLWDVLRGTGIYIGNDSGVSHLASLSGTPGVVLFGPTDPVVWRPLGTRITVVTSPDGTMNGISVEDVLRRIENIQFQR